MSVNIVQNEVRDFSGNEVLKPTSQDNLSVSENKSDQKSSGTTAQSAAGDRVSVSEVWEKAARDFDVRHATPRDIIALSRTLYKAAAITYDDHINLSFQPEDNADTPTESKPFSHDRKDYISVWQNKLDNVVRSGGDRTQIEESQRIQAILIYVDSLKG
ncbi:hypothetical protein [Paremcibacter congregatus]|uniref:Uncharacterized protein n=1 Tax=Paremcibacter congregatus TaxID=2043170 RepID=A0A2G4YU37_9PROT|nr:hypothetical protein [Paremcibacter congregatus]PHZ85852.1 hypothetical protein CRD36_04015 [Paremcibacter congregatus]QDE26815.1 hypothetical protein FIV45_05780 [Paremcibacter congregatus]